jgi:hypothetical protein
LEVFWSIGAQTTLDECGLKKMNFREHSVHRGEFRIYAREYAGTEPTIILMHGFPDNLHLYDRLVPLLSPPRRLWFSIFSGGALLTSRLAIPTLRRTRKGIWMLWFKQLNLAQVVPVAHDASGPPKLRPPEAFFLFSTPLIRSVARPISALFNHLIFRRMYWWQVGKFFRDAEIGSEFVPLLYQQFDATPSTRHAFFRLNEDLLPTIRSRSKMTPQLKDLRRPV